MVDLQDQNWNPVHQLWNDWKVEFAYRRLAKIVVSELDSDELSCYVVCEVVGEEPEGEPCKQ